MRFANVRSRDPSAPQYCDEYRREDLVRSVVRHDFHPLIAGKLRVVVEDEGGRSVLDRNGIEQAVSDPELVRLRPLVALARWGLGLGDGHRVPRVEAPPAGAAPKWSDGLMAAEDVEPLRADFEAGREVAVDVGLWVHPSKRTVDAVQTTFRVLMQREDEHLRGSGQFVRRGIPAQAARR